MHVMRNVGKRKISIFLNLAFFCDLRICSHL